MILRTATIVFAALAFSCITTNSFAQANDDMNTIDPGPFADAAHHWYGVYEKTNIIFAKPNQPRYNRVAIDAVARGDVSVGLEGLASRCFARDRVRGPASARSGARARRSSLPQLPRSTVLGPQSSPCERNES